MRDWIEAVIVAILVVALIVWGTYTIIWVGGMV